MLGMPGAALCWACLSSTSPMENRHFPKDLLLLSRCPPASKHFGSSPAAGSARNPHPILCGLSPHGCPCAVVPHLHICMFAIFLCKWGSQLELELALPFSAELQPLVLLSSR